MKDETKKKIKKGALIALQVTLGGFALLGMLSTGALVKSCSKGEIGTTAVVATTPVVGQRVKKAPNSVTSSFNSWDDIRGKTFQIKSSWNVSWSATDLMWSSSWNFGTFVNGKNQTCNLQNINFEKSGTYYSVRITSDKGSNIVWFSSWQGLHTDTDKLPANGQLVFSDLDKPSGQASKPDSAFWTIFNTAFDYVSGATPSGAPITYDYAYCAPVGTLPDVVPLDYTSVTLQFQADSGYGFPDTAETISGYTQIYSEGLVIDSYQYGGYLGNGLYNAIEIQCSRDSDPPAESCHISVSALSTTGFEYPEWKTLRVLGTHCTIYMADDQFDSDGVVHLQAYPDTGYYFDQDRAFIGNQLKEYYGAEVIMYDLSTGGLYLTIRKNTENLVVNQSPYIEITPLAGNVPVGGSEMGQAFDLLKDGFAALLPLFMIQVLPGITLGMLFMVPFIVILVMFILKVVHK